MIPMRVLAFLAVLLCVAGAAHGRGRTTLSLELDREQALRGSASGLEIFGDIERGWHINAHKPNQPFLIPTEVTLTLPDGVTAEPLLYPRPDRHKFAFAPGKELLVYEGKIGVTTAITVSADYPGTTLTIGARMRYQACNDTTCLPPATTEAELVVPVTATTVAADGTASAATTGGVDIDVGSWVAEHGLPLTLLLMLVLGLGLNLTPCVYPLISVTVAFFGTQGHDRWTRTAGLAAVYVLGITSSFSAVGVAAALSGDVFGAALQKPPVLIFIAAVLVLLAMSSFGLYQLQPPAWLMQRMSGSTQGFAGSFFMGLTMGIVAAPCVGPVVIGLLLFVGAQQSVGLGVMLFFALGLGLGLPYLALALAAGSIRTLPRSGQWLVWVERVFGFLLLALAAYFITPLLPEALRRWAIPGLIAVAGLYLGFIDRSGRAMPYFRSLQRALGAAAIAVAVWIAQPHAAESAIRWQSFSPASIETSVAVSRPAIVDFIADWCIPCHEMDRTTYTDDDVQREAERFEMFKADITRETEAVDALVAMYDVQGVPTVIFVDSAGNEVERLVGYVGPEEMLAAMRRIQ
jgi:thiol:disulfide interchange protein DsbD